MIDIQQLSAGYQNRPVLHEIDLTIPSGQVTILVGPNGCGKTTLLKALCGMIPLQSGCVRLDGAAISTLTPRQRAQKIAYLAQNRPVPDISVERMVLHGRFPYLDYPRRYRDIDRAAAQAAMAHMGISHLAEESVAALSGGTRQKVYIAMALAQDAPVILLDEPTAFLDISHQMLMIRQAQQLAQQGKTVLLIIHDLSLALRASQHLVVMEHGRIVTAAPPEEVFASRCLDAVFDIKTDRFMTETGWQYYFT